MTSEILILHFGIVSILFLPLNVLFDFSRVGGGSIYLF
jgi:hypothetical protein